MSITLRRITGAVADEFGVTPPALDSNRRSGGVVTARAVRWWLARQLTAYSYTQIARDTHRDHSTVMSGIKRLEGEFKSDRALAEKCDSLCRRLAEESRASEGAKLPPYETSFAEFVAMAERIGYRVHVVKEQGETA